MVIRLSIRRTDLHSRVSYLHTIGLIISTMTYIYYTFAAILLYLGSDRILNRIEVSRGQRFEHRSLIFFVIILVLATASFKIIEYLSTG